MLLKTKTRTPPPFEGLTAKPNQAQRNIIGFVAAAVEDAVIEKLFRSDMPWPEVERAISESRSQEAAEQSAMASKLAARSSKRGRPPMTKRQRRERYPIHRAAHLVTLAEEILASAYPQRKKKELMPYAYEAAIRLVDDPDSPGKPITALKLQYYLDRSKKGRLQRWA